MLAAAVFAIYEAENAVPATAPADFTAGVINGFNSDIDVHALMMECFTPDQEMADETDALIQALKDKKFDEVKDIVMKFEPKAIADTSKCMTDPKYADIKAAYENQAALVEKVKNDPDWQLHGIKSIRKSIPEIKESAKGAISKWNSGDYYGAGQEIGNIDAIVFSYWESNSAFLQ
mmetsp:Transcript_7270/g.10221  ORF Transcript_7270/g.10221 Transcript_7270/m.10221 type:complete len:176 (+) Transcript_7270:44-571(+)